MLSNDGVLLKTIDTELLKCWYILQIKKIVVRSLPAYLTLPCLTHSRSMVSFYILWRLQGTRRFLMLLEGIERGKWPQIHQITKNKVLTTSFSLILHEDVINVALIQTLIQSIFSNVWFQQWHYSPKWHLCVFFSTKRMYDYWECFNNF